MFNEIRILGQLAQRAIKQIRAPSLIIQGSLDELVKTEITHKFLQQFVSDVQYIEVESTHEIMKVEAHIWSEISHAVLKFTQQIEA